MVEIISGWSYTMDDNQYILYHTYQREKLDFKTRKPIGELVEKKDEVGYFTSLEGMLNRLTELICKEKIEAGEIKTIKGHIAELRRLRAELGKMCDYEGK